MIVRKLTSYPDDTTEAVAIPPSVLELPVPSLATLERIEQIVSRITTAQRRDQIAQAIAKEVFESNFLQA